MKEEILDEWHESQQHNIYAGFICRAASSLLDAALISFFTILLLWGLNWFYMFKNIGPLIVTFFCIIAFLYKVGLERYTDKHLERNGLAL